MRLWPTTLVVLRESVAPTEWAAGTAPAGTEFAIVTSVFHRDDQALEFANHFEPEIWLDGRSDGEWPLIPFSAGPRRLPGVARGAAPTPITDMAASSPVTDATSDCSDADQALTVRAPCSLLSIRCSNCIGVLT
ncbi:cytochrome P450 [Kribbella sp. VKM Ac-2568]|uniref:cytochrome P450 n=1 Tax=Kribbella sp. VKM Ac-2568 TaxID=2512219 RepID=UPI0010468B63